MVGQDRLLMDELPQQAIFALDIGTRSIIGMIGVPEEERMQVVAIERVEHTQRAMVDGQIENIDQVARIAGMVKDKLEQRIGCRLTRVAVAAAGRALRTESITYEMELPEVQRISAETVSRLEAGAISEVEKKFLAGEENDHERRFYLVGYSVCRYYLDNYIISSLIDHHGKILKADIIATFLPSEVVESLYATMHKIGLEIASLTLEPIAAINATIPPNIRLLNLAMVDIGAGTSDIAVCRDGSITGYTMAVQAGDEITETVMREYLVDFETAEKIKSDMNDSEEIVFTDIMGFEQTVSREQLFESVKDASSRLCEEICSKIIEANGGVPSAVYLAGGGSQLLGLKEGITEQLHMDPKRVAIAGRNFKANAYSEAYDLDNPEYATPLGIMISAGLNMINDSFRVILNGQAAKLFRSGTFTVMNILMMNGYSYQDMIGKSGQNLVVSFNGQRKVFYGEKSDPCVLKLNGRDTQLSDYVRAGDKIDFVPARHGKDAKVMLSRLADIGGEHEITVNGVPVLSDVELKPGDVILVHGMHETEEEQEEEAEKEIFSDEPEAGTGDAPKASAAESPEFLTESVGGREAHQEPEEEKAAVTQGDPAQGDLTQGDLAQGDLTQGDLAQGDLAQAESSEAQPAARKERLETLIAGILERLEASSADADGRMESERLEKMAEEAVELREESSEVDKDGREEPSAADKDVQEKLSAADSDRREEPAGTEAGPAKKLRLYLNDKPLVLAPKPDESPYYLMDMLEYSGLDLKNLTAPVTLEVNGENGAFQQELKNGDRIRIYQQI